MTTKDQSIIQLDFSEIPTGIMLSALLSRVHFPMSETDSNRFSEEYYMP